MAVLLYGLTWFAQGIESAVQAEVTETLADNDLAWVNVDVSGQNVELQDFTMLFAAISAAACAPPTAGVQADENPRQQSRASQLGAAPGSFLESLLSDDNVSAKRVA